MKHFPVVLEYDVALALLVKSSWLPCVMFRWHLILASDELTF